MPASTHTRIDSKPAAGQREWVASRDALRLVADAYALHDIVAYESKELQQRAAISKAADAIMRRLTEGTLVARPIWFRFTQGNCVDASEHVFRLNDSDRAIDPNFWRTLQRLWLVATIDWIAGDFSFEERDGDFWATGYASGVKFDRTALPAVDRQYARPIAKVGGAPRKWDWDGALIHLAALAHKNADGLLRDDASEPNQSDIARHLQAWFVDTCDDAPESSQLREYGKRFVTELNAMKLRDANNSSDPG